MNFRKCEGCDVDVQTWGLKVLWVDEDEYIEVCPMCHAQAMSHSENLKHVTDGGECWCAPEVLVVCPECGGVKNECWCCGGTRYVDWDGSPDVNTLVVHRRLTSQDGPASTPDA